MRIVGGELRGRRLRAPRGAATRPTADRVKEALFNILGPPLPGTRALDVYAGSGALGLEALSRGCTDVVLIERAHEALVALQQNIEALGVPARARILRDDALRALARLAREKQAFGWIFLDPPYAAEVLSRSLEAAAPVCAAEATIIAEHDVRHPPGEQVGALVRTDVRRYGDTCLSFYEKPGPAPAAEATCEPLAKDEG